MQDVVWPNIIVIFFKKQDRFLIFINFYFTATKICILTLYASILYTILSSVPAESHEAINAIDNTVTNDKLDT